MSAVLIKVSERTSVTKTFEVTGAEAIAKRYATYEFRPTRLVLQVIDGGLNAVNISGPRVKKDGTDGEMIAEERLYSRRDYPKWLLHMLEGMGL